MPPETQVTQHVITRVVDQELRHCGRATALGFAKDEFDDRRVGREPLAIRRGVRMFTALEAIFQFDRQQLAQQGAVLEAIAGQLGQIGLDDGRLAGLQRLLEALAKPIDRTQIIQRKPRIAPRVGRFV